MRLADQKDSMPTNKFITLVGGIPVLYALIGDAIREAYTASYPSLPAFLTGPKVTDLVVALVPTLIVGGIAYFVKDRPNIPQ